MDTRECSGKWAEEGQSDLAVVMRRRTWLGPIHNFVGGPRHAFAKGLGSCVAPFFPFRFEADYVTRGGTTKINDHREKTAPSAQSRMVVFLLGENFKHVSFWRQKKREKRYTHTCTHTSCSNHEEKDTKKCEVTI